MSVQQVIAQIAQKGRQVLSFWLAIVLCGISILLAYVASKQTTEQQHEVLVAEPSTYDFGTVFQAKVLDARISLVNNSNHEVRILDVMPSCSCNAVNVSDKVVPSRGSTVVKAQFHTGGSRGTSSTRVLIKYQLSEERNDYGFAQIRLTAKIVPDLELAPERLVFRKGQKSAQEIRWSPGRLSDIKVTEVSVTHRAFSARIDGHRIVVTFDPAKWYGGEDVVYLELRNTSPNVPVCSVPLAVAATAESLPK